MHPAISDYDIVLLLGVVCVVAFFFAILAGAQGSGGRRWWHSRFGVGWPTIAFLYVLIVSGLWLPLAFGPTSPGRANLAYFVAGLLFVGGCIPIARSVGNLRPLLLLERTSVVHASDATPGRLAVEGTVRAAGGDPAAADATLEAPLSGATAVAYRLKVDAMPADATDDERDRQRTTEANVERTREFAVRDDTGAVRVDPTDAQLRVSADDERCIEPDDEVPAAFDAFLDREDVDRTGSTLLCEEATLEPGDEAFVFGAASRDESDVVVDGGREFLIIPGSRRDAVYKLRSVVLWGGAGGAIIALVGEVGMAVVTGAL
jgi:hypothetical protein